MKQFTSSILALWALLLLGACSDDSGQEPDAGLPTYGSACTTDEACASGLCVEGLCSMTCKRQSDCPVAGTQAFHCGEVRDGLLGCYPRTYPTGEGGMGHDCSLDGKCANDLRCLGESGAADRYCASKCEDDLDCPPRYRCSQVRVGQDLEPDKYCRLRQFCHPCVMDDQCGGPDDLCVKDINGAGYCGKACTAGSGTCPPYAKCEDAGNNTLQCRHKAGMCFKSLEAEGELCDPCIVHGWTTKATGGSTGCSTSQDCPGFPHEYCLKLSTKSVCLQVQYTIAEEGSCKEGGFCMLLDRYTGEGACVTPCDSSGQCPGANYSCSSEQSSVTTSLGKQLCVPVTDNKIGSCVQ